MAPESPNPATDELDDLFDYNVTMEDVFRDTNVAMDVPNSEPTAHTTSRDKDLGLGIDEEIKVTKKRQPIPKLDDNRLLSQAGIPKLRRLAKERLKFKGKGHEYSDLASLLNLYQFWLDDLYPRAKFADGLAMIEKLGHSKRIQVMRREWINEGKPWDRLGDIDVSSDSQRVIKESNVAGKIGTTASANQTPEDPDLHPSSARDEEDLYGASPPRQKQTIIEKTAIDSDGTAQNLQNTGDTSDEVPEDDLDILLAEPSTDSLRSIPISSPSTNRQNATPFSKKDNFDDEMEVMAEMDDLW